MKLAVIDSETSGLFDFSKPADAEGQPRLAELAVILIDGDNIDERHYLVRPEGWEMTVEATAVNGLTTEYLRDHGVPVGQVLDAYAQIVADGFVVVAHNAQYDTKIMRGELRRAGRPDLFEQTPNICTMRASMAICDRRNKRGGLRFPKLEEAYAHFHGGEPLPGLDDLDVPSKALRDARACADVMRSLRRADALPEPAVHYAKTRPAPSPPAPETTQAPAPAEAPAAG